MYRVDRVRVSFFSQAVFEYFYVSMLCNELTECSSLNNLSSQFNGSLTRRVSTVHFHHGFHATVLSHSSQPTGIVIIGKELT